MTPIGCSGHQLVPDAARRFVRDGIAAVLTRADAPIVGLSSLAVGADQLFAELVLDAGGDLKVIVPSDEYESTFDADGRARYVALLAAAREVEKLTFPAPTEAAFLAAGRRIVDECELLIAVWDGLRARGVGGTADIVEYARRLGRPVEVVWPSGVARA